jgi:hypothetical protein
MSHTAENAPTQQATGAQATTAAQGANDRGATGNGGDNVLEELSEALAKDPPTWPWTWLAFIILAAGTALSYVVWRLVKPTDFMPSSDYAVYAGLFIMALAIERILEPFSGWFMPSTKNEKAAATAKAAQAKLAQATGRTNPQAQKEAAVAQKKFHLAQSGRAVLMWATASVLAMVLCASLGIFLLRSAESPTTTGESGTSVSVKSLNTTPQIPSPAKDPNRLLDLLVTGLVVGAGTKPLHDLITQIQTSSGTSKANSSSAMPTG